ncbi:hypothetical protein BDR06DRAFT_978158, partial [Suillus hirtellus]
MPWFGSGPLRLGLVRFTNNLADPMQTESLIRIESSTQKIENYGLSWLANVASSPKSSFKLMAGSGLVMFWDPAHMGRAQVVVAPTAAEPLPTAGPIPIITTIATPAIAITPTVPTITPAIPAITPATPAITPIPTAIPQANNQTHAVPSHTAEEESFDLNVSGDKDKDEVTASPLQTTMDTTWTNPHATGTIKPITAEFAKFVIADDQAINISKIWIFSITP